jgi:hypothetical protein
MLSSSLWARFVQGISCLSRAACLVHPCKAYQYNSVDSHVMRIIDTGSSGPRCPGGQSFLSSPNKSCLGNLSLGILNMTRGQPLESFALQLWLRTDTSGKIYILCKGLHLCNMTTCGTWLRKGIQQMCHKQFTWTTAKGPKCRFTTAHILMSKSTVMSEPAANALIKQSVQCIVVMPQASVMRMLT